MKISLVIPMYNESSVIEATAKTLSEYMRERFDDYEIIFSDDGSTDGCREIVERLGLENVRVVGEAQNRGKGSAVRIGMLEACGEIRIFTDADLAYGTEVIGKARDVLANTPEADMLIGSRNIERDGYSEYTFLRRVMSKIYIRLVRLAGGIKLSDCQCGFKAFRAESAEHIFARCKTDGFSFDFEVMLRASAQNMRVVEMPIRILNHRSSSIKPIKDAIKMLGDIRKIKKEVRGGK